MINYDKLFTKMKEQGKTKANIRENKIIGQETLRKIKVGTGVLEEYIYKYKDDNGVQQSEKKTRETSIDTKSIESLCVWLGCQPSDIMEVIPNTWDNAEKLCKILNCTIEELPKKVDMKK